MVCLGLEVSEVWGWVGFLGFVVVLGEYKRVLGGSYDLVEWVVEDGVDVELGLKLMMCGGGIGCVVLWSNGVEFCN